MRDPVKDNHGISKEIPQVQFKRLAGKLTIIKNGRVVGSISKDGLSFKITAPMEVNENDLYHIRKKTRHE